MSNIRGFIDYNNPDNCDFEMWRDSDIAIFDAMTVSQALDSVEALAVNLGGDYEYVKDEATNSHIEKIIKDGNVVCTTTSKKMADSNWMITVEFNQHGLIKKYSVKKDSTGKWTQKEVTV